MIKWQSLVCIISIIQQKPNYQEQTNYQEHTDLQDTPTSAKGPVILET